eukprot:1892707-Prorocentrum_lima.AAC.1
MKLDPHRTLQHLQNIGAHHTKLQDPLVALFYPTNLGLQDEGNRPTIDLQQAAARAWERRRADVWK